VSVINKLQFRSKDCLIFAEVASSADNWVGILRTVEVSSVSIGAISTTSIVAIAEVGTIVRTVAAASRAAGTSAVKGLG